MISSEIGDLIEQSCVPEGSRQNLYAATVAVDWGSTDEASKILLTDAQTSGGLLLCVTKRTWGKCLRSCEKHARRALLSSEKSLRDGGAGH